MFFDKALERAKELDEYLEKEGKPIGPLHGLPISLKVHLAERQPPWDGAADGLTSRIHLT